MFKRLHLQTPVTCIEVVKDNLIAGFGGILHVYRLPDNVLLQKKEIFQDQNIFGIKPNSDGSSILVYGGKHIGLVSFKDSWEKKNNEDFILSDWILDAKWIDNDTKLATVFMNNKISVWTDNFKPQSSVKCAERCISYSAFICRNTYDQLIVLSGTVFCEILLWKPSITDEDGLSIVLKRLVHHKGAIFSIHANFDTSLICSASDDRSAVLWEIKNPDSFCSIKPTNSDMISVNVKCQVYGHLSRVFRCLILNDMFITAGEDSQVILWNFQGGKIKDFEFHQGGPVWSICCKSDCETIFSGGDDGALLVFKTKPYILRDTLSLPNLEKPKIIGILNNSQIVCFTVEGVLYLLNKYKEPRKICDYSDLKRYCIMQISPCKKMVALAGFDGQIYIYGLTNGMLIHLYTHILKNKSRIFSFNWLDCKRFLVSQAENALKLFFIYRSAIHFIQTFNLPGKKEPWPTCACGFKDNIVIGNRKGHIYHFRIGLKDPVSSRINAHSFLGVTHLFVEDNIIVSLGKDGLIRKYTIYNNLMCSNSTKTKYSWLVGLKENVLLSFSGDNYLVSDIKYQRSLLKIKCGGGHRSWDYLKHKENISLIYIKRGAIESIKVNINDIKPGHLVDGYHVREINCIKVIDIEDKHLIISGGEDTLLRLSVIDDNGLSVLQCLKVHLSSIRTIAIYPLGKNEITNENCSEYFVFTGGGRAQIIYWHLKVTYHLGKLSALCTEKYNFYEPLDENNGETRIMVLDVANVQDKILLFAGCSDGYTKIFIVNCNMTLNFQNSISRRFGSITKLTCFAWFSKHFLATMGTDGILQFWLLEEKLGVVDAKLFGSFCLHQSGINCYSYLVKDTFLLFLTGGDDNLLRLTYFGLTNDNIVKINSFEDVSIHCAQITGAYLSDKYFISSGIDQRVAICSWSSEEKQIHFKMVDRYNSVIADPQGLEVTTGNLSDIPNNTLNLYLYGNGLECLRIALE
ncbi:WD repeat-containing protein 6 [Anthonomus grandis grandis]|uniref:WD repeat-containing protein 6 n=1 Tax=Anthonomus grandis grandis TaxID=2921223 RepID=UPI0021668D51|nr:WD repeat-containing protein 6 [Anthonomus grandis grandis]